jgi:hypothetical protein
MTEGMQGIRKRLGEQLFATIVFAFSTFLVMATTCENPHAT